MKESKRIKQIKRWQIKQMNKAYNDLIKELANIYSDVKLKEGKLFKLDNQPKNKKAQSTRAFRKYRKRILKIIEESRKNAWDEAEKQFIKETEERLERVKDKIDSDEFQKQLKQIEKMRSDFADRSNFLNRKIANTTISDRVWDLQNLAKQNIENALTDALGKGKSAQELARAIKHNLNRPNALFRRVRDKIGKLVESKPMRAYKSGRGVYKSAHKNAMRLARTEINTAYRKSEQVSMLKNNDIVGQRIRVSHSHKVEDICDQLQGDYPVDFDWHGWHPQCMCIREFIQKTDEEFIEELRRGKVSKPETSKRFVKDVPENFKRWLSENQDKINRMKRKPNFLKNNRF